MPHPARLRAALQVKVAITDLAGKVLDRFLLDDLRPEVCIESDDLRYHDRDFSRRVGNAFYFKRLPVTVHAPFLRIDAGSTDGPTRNHARQTLERALRLAGYFRPVTIVCHAGPRRDLEHGELADWIERAMPTFAWMHRACADMGAVLALENIRHQYPALLLPCFEELEGARWCFDLGHMNVFSSVPALEWVRVLGPHLGQLHLHDNFGDSDRHLPAGHGNIDYRTLLAALGGLPAPLAATAEVHHGHEFSASVEYLAPMWPWETD